MEGTVVKKVAPHVYATLDQTQKRSNAQLQWIFMDTLAFLWIFMNLPAYPRPANRIPTKPRRLMNIHFMDIP